MPFLGTGTEIMLDPDRYGNPGVYMTAYWPGAIPCTSLSLCSVRGILAFARESAGEELRRVARLERHLYRGFLRSGKDLP